MTRRLHTAGLAGFLTALTLATGVALAGPGSAQTAGEPPRDRVAKMTEELGLDEVQVAALEDMRTTIQEGREGARAELEQIKGELDAELALAEPNSRTVHKLLDDKLEIRNGLAHDKMDAFLDFRATLTPEQREAFDAKAKARGAHRHKARGRQGGQGAQGTEAPLWEER